MDHRFRLSNDALLACLGGAVFLVLAGAVVSATLNLEKRTGFRFPATGRAPTSSFNFPEGERRLDLGKGWEFVVTGDALDPAQVETDPLLFWKPFDLDRSWEHADEIRGHYWLRHSFEWSPSSHALRHPSIVLGLLATHHRVYLNGRFLGGSNYFGTLSRYSFDPSLLDEGGRNTILVKAYTEPTMLPGITKIGEVGAFLGEFEDVEELLWKNRVGFHALNLVYLILTLVAGFLAAAFFTFHPKRTEYLYFSLYLFLGAISLCYHNAYFVNALDYQFHRFLKVFSLALSSFVLFSTISYLRGWKGFQRVNNLGALAAAAALAVGLLGQKLEPSVFGERYTWAFRAATIYSVWWLAYALYGAVADLAEKRRSKLRATQTDLVGGVLLLSGILTALLSYTSGWAHFSSASALLSAISRTGTLHSFVFAVFVVALMAYNQATAASRLAREKAKGALVVETVRMLRDTRDLPSVISVIQEKFCTFVGCERSTIYLLEQQDEKTFLTASYFFGEKRHEQAVRKEIMPDEGLIGKVVQTKRGLLIQDVGELAVQRVGGENGHDSFKTGSCMLHPLLIGDELVGVLTLADKKDGTPFTPEDFEVVQNATTDLCFIVQNARLRARLGEQIDGIIYTLTKVIEKRDPYTEFHSQGVCYLVEQLCHKMGKPVTTELRMAALLHDVGKIFVPRRILNKPGKLTPEERQIIEQHSRWSQEVLQTIPGFKTIGQWAGMHHETLDGGGYPYGLTGDLIPIEAQIITVADFIDALSTNRAYRARYPFEKVEGLLDEMATKQKFSPAIAAAGKDVLRSPEFRRLYSEKSDAYRPQHESREEAAVAYYLKILEDLGGYLNELNTILGDDSVRLSRETIKRTQKALTDLGEEHTMLETNLKRNPAA